MPVQFHSMIGCGHRCGVRIQAARPISAGGLRFDNTARSGTLDTTLDVLNASFIQARAIDVLPLIRGIERVGVRGHEATSRNEITESHNPLSRNVSVAKKHQNPVGFLGSSSANRGNPKGVYTLVRSSPKITGSSTFKERTFLWNWSIGRYSEG